MVLSTMMSEALAGTEIVEAIGNAVPPRAAAEYTLIVMLAADAEVFATTIEFTLNAIPLDAALDMSEVAAVVVKETEDAFPLIVVTLTKFGFAMSVP